MQLIGAAGCTLALLSLVFVPTAGAAGQRWRIVRSPSPGKAGLNAVSALSSSDAWAVGGYFSSASGGTLTLHWDGVRWRHIPSPSPTSNSTLTSVLALSHDDVWAVGYTSHFAGGDKTLIEHWDGSAWSIVPSPNPRRDNDLNAIMGVSRNHLWAVGRTDHSLGERNYGLIEEWDGMTWSVVRHPQPGFDSFFWGGTSLTDKEAWAVGAYDGRGCGAYCFLAERWDGSRWTKVPTRGDFRNSDNNLWAVGGSSPKDVWAVAWDGGRSDLVQHWNGRAWHRASFESVGEYGPSFTGVAAQSVNSAWAVGVYSADEQSRFSTLTEHWNGTAWSVVGSPNRGSSDFSGVAAIPGTDDVWAVGQGDGSTLIELYS